MGYLYNGIFAQEIWGVLHGLMTWMMQGASLTAGPKNCMFLKIKIWQCVKTYSTPVVHIKIAGIHGCSSP